MNYYSKSYVYESAVLGLLVFLRLLFGCHIFLSLQVTVTLQLHVFVRIS